jgi:hypothetical protein
MHESWWIFVGLQKIKFSAAIEDGRTTKAQSQPHNHKGAMFNLFHLVKVTLITLHNFTQMIITLFI